ncbi:hypothetical protein [Yoonia sp. R2-816]|uniref:hypothetical protein n=1 Tax=Yoonia sp. R2-816 TaxID=3342638 RepID=UPI00372D38FD
MCEAYRRLVRTPMAIFREINPNRTNNPAICPETADALGDFLNSDDVRPIRTRSNSATFHISARGRWQPVSYGRIGHGLANCSHDVIESTRHGDQRYPNHYFIVFRVDNRIHIADAFTHELMDSMDDYARAADFDPADMRDPEKWTFRRMAGRRYDVTIRDPLAGLDDMGDDPIAGAEAGF